MIKRQFCPDCGRRLSFEARDPDREHDGYWYSVECDCGFEWSSSETYANPIRAARMMYEEWDAR